MKSLQLRAGALVSLIALFLAFHGVDFAAVGRAFLGANYFLLSASTLLVCGSILLRARRWQAFFPRSEKLRLSSLFGVLNVGYLVNNVLPFRAGELVRGVLLGQVERVGRVEAFSTIIVERVVDTLGVIVLLAVTLPFVHIGGAATRPIAALAVALLMLVLAMLLATTRRATALRLVRGIARVLPLRLRAPALSHAESAIRGLSSLSDPRAAAEVAGLTVLVYLTLVVAMEAQLAAFHMSLPPAGPVFLLAAATLGLVVPASPAGVGVWEGIVIGTLTGIFAAGRSEATSLALVSHVVFFAPPMLIAAVYLWRLGASWSGLVGITRGQIAAIEPAIVPEDGG